MTRTFAIDALTDTIKRLMEAGRSKEEIVESMGISEETFCKHVNYLYARTFDIASKNWVNNAEYNKMYIKMQEHYMNDRLRAVGHVFLNEVYDILGVPRSAQGQLVGWFHNPYSDLIEFDIVDNTEDGGFIIAFNPHGVIVNQLPIF